MCQCNCNGITLPVGAKGDQGPTGPAGNDGGVIIDSIFDRDLTHGLAFTEINSIPIDITKVFNAVGDGLEYEVVFSYHYSAGNDGGNVRLILTDTGNTIVLGTAPAIGDKLQSCIIKGTIIRVSDSAVNYTAHIAQPTSLVYSAPTSIVNDLSQRGQSLYISRDPGTIDNTSVNLKLSAQGILNGAANSIIVEEFIVKSIKKLV